MTSNLGFYLSGVIAAGIIFIGCRFLLAPSTAATAYGVPAGAEPHLQAYLSAKGIRDIASGLFVAMLMAYGSTHVLGWFMLIATLIPIADAMIVLRQGGSRTIAFGVHGSTAVAMLIISGLLLIDWWKSRRNRIRHMWRRELAFSETGTSIIAKLTSLTPTILTAALAVIFVVAGIINIIGRGTVKTDFARWGFPDGFNIVCGGLELVGAALLLAPSTRFWGLALLGMIMTGAIFSLLRYREPISHLAPALGIATLLALDSIALSAGSFLAPLPWNMWWGSKRVLSTADQVID